MSRRKNESFTHFIAAEITSEDTTKEELPVTEEVEEEVPVANIPKAVVWEYRAGILVHW
jgi:hypothetical protein